MIVRFAPDFSTQCGSSSPEQFAFSGRGEKHGHAQQFSLSGFRNRTPMKKEERSCTPPYLGLVVARRHYSTRLPSAAVLNSFSTRVSILGGLPSRYLLRHLMCSDFSPSLNCLF